MSTNEVPSYLTIYGSIRSINILGPTHILNIIYPIIDQLLRSISRDVYTDETIEIDQENEKKYEDINILPSDAMIVDQPSQICGSLPKVSFSLMNMPITSSIFSEISCTNVINFKKEKKGFEGGDEDTQIIKLLKTKRINNNLMKKAFYVYYALKVNKY